MHDASKENFVEKNNSHVSPLLPCFSCGKKRMLFGFSMSENMVITTLRESNETLLWKVMSCVKLKVRSF
jgi:hypothetical protein